MGFCDELRAEAGQRGGSKDQRKGGGIRSEKSKTDEAEKAVSHLSRLKRGGDRAKYWKPPQHPWQCTQEAKILCRGHPLSKVVSSERCEGDGDWRVLLPCDSRGAPSEKKIKCGNGEKWRSLLEL